MENPFETIVSKVEISLVIEQLFIDGALNNDLESIHQFVEDNLKLSVQDAMNDGLWLQNDLFPVEFIDDTHQDENEDPDYIVAAKEFGNVMRCRSEIIGMLSSISR